MDDSPPRFGPDTPLPGAAAIAALWDLHGMPEHIREHSQAVCAVALQVADWLVAGGVRLYRPAVEAGALLHDLAKAPCLADGTSHDRAGERLLREHGYPELGYVAGVHVTLPDDHPLDEAVVVYYADKRVQHTALVSLADRFDDLIERYGEGDPLRIAYLDAMRERTVAVERRLFAATGGRRPGQVTLGGPRGPRSSGP